MRRAPCAARRPHRGNRPGAAQTVDLNALIPAGGASASGRIIELVALLTVLSVAPGLLIMVTSFTRFIVALVVPALRPRPAERAGQSRPDQPRRCS